MSDAATPHQEAKGSHIAQANGGGIAIVGDGNVVNLPAHRIPLQRPPRTPYFQDRKDDLAQLLADLQAGRVVTLCGPGGIGKSALAAEAVWHLAPAAAPPARFPDGILFYSFYNQPQAAFALEHIARSFGEEIKPTPHAAAQRALAGRRALLLLDGAEDADDLRQVLTVCDQCSVVVTSRQRRDQVDKRQDVAPLPLADAVALLQAWGGARASDDAATRRIAELVGRLPLALRLVGRYLAQHEEAAGDYLTWLEKTPLTALDQGQRQAESVPLLLQCSLAQVSAIARRVLGIVGLLALAPFPRAAITAALALADDASRMALGELVNYGLLLRPAEPYEVAHALIHTYARLQLAPSPEEAARLAAYYTTFVNEQQGKFAQLNSIRPHVLALIHSCWAQQAWAAVSSLAWAIDDYLNLQGYWTDRIFVNEHNLAAARATVDRWDESALLGNLGNVYVNLGQVEGAIAYHQQALVIARDIDDRSGEGTWLGNLGAAYHNLGQVEGAIDYYQQALVIARDIGDRSGEGTWLGNLGIAYHNLGQVEGAIDYYQQALVIARAIGDRSGEGNTLGDLGTAYCDLEQVEGAIAYYQQALAIAREIGDRSGEGDRLGNLGIAYHKLEQVEGR